MCIFLYMCVRACVYVILCHRHLTSGVTIFSFSPLSGSTKEKYRISFQDVTLGGLLANFSLYVPFPCTQAVCEEELYSKH